MATAKKGSAKKTADGKLRQFTGMDKVHYDALMRARDAVMGQMRCHAEDALDCSNADKRGVTTHMADMGSDNSRHEMELRMLTEEGNVLELIEGALQRLSEGKYGKCLDCGEPIPEARLEVRPYAIYCIKCKTIREKNNGINPHDKR